MIELSYLDLKKNNVLSLVRNTLELLSLPLYY